MKRILPLICLLSIAPLSAHSAPMVELFTSQGCYSCPPAEEHLADLIEKSPDLVALEFHVDYWDDLRYGSAGVWKDPFSDAAYTKRQRHYNQQPLKGKKGVYTPQMIVNGSVAQVGSSRSAVKKALDKAEALLQLETSVENNRVDVAISGHSAAKAQVWLAIFDRKQVTEVTRGENHGKELHNYHVVRELKPVADWRDGGGSVSIDVPELADANVGCAVFVQDSGNGKILGATYCQSS